MRRVDQFSREYYSTNDLWWPHPAPISPRKALSGFACAKARERDTAWRRENTTAGSSGGCWKAKGDVGKRPSWAWPHWWPDLGLVCELQLLGFVFAAVLQFHWQEEYVTTDLKLFDFYNCGPGHTLYFIHLQKVRWLVWKSNHWWVGNSYAFSSFVSSLRICLVPVGSSTVF